MRKNGWFNFGAGVAALLATSCLTFAAPIPDVGVQFIVPGNNGGPTSTALLTSQTAGLYPQSNFNVITETTDGQGTGGTTVTSGALNNASGTATGVTLSRNTTDAWANGTDGTTANGALLQGESKASNGNTSTYVFNNVPAGIYSIVSYIEVDTAGITSTYKIGSNSQSVLEQDTTGTPAFTAATATTAGNYVEFDNISVPAGGGSITMTVSPVSGGNVDAAVNGIQLLVAPEPASLSLLGLGSLWLLGRRRHPI